MIDIIRIYCLSKPTYASWILSILLHECENIGYLYLSTIHRLVLSTSLMDDIYFVESLRLPTMKLVLYNYQRLLEYASSFFFKYILVSWPCFTKGSWISFSYLRGFPISISKLILENQFLLGLNDTHTWCNKRQVFYSSFRNCWVVQAITALISSLVFCFRSFCFILMYVTVQIFLLVSQILQFG